MQIKFIPNVLEKDKRKIIDIEDVEKSLGCL